MSPPAATYENGDSDKQPSFEAPLEPGITQHGAKVQMQKFPGPPKFEDKYEERRYLKGRLAAAFRIFGKYGFDEGVAGHITIRVRQKLSLSRLDRFPSRLLTTSPRIPSIRQPSG